MNTFVTKINKSFTSRKGIEDSKIKNINLIIPTDYIELLRASDGIEFESDMHISLDKINPVSIFNEFLNLEWLVKERAYDLSEKDSLSYVDQFLKIGLTLNQDRILIGNNAETMNQIHYYDYEEDKTIFICDSIVIFINDHLIK